MREKRLLLVAVAFTFLVALVLSQVPIASPAMAQNGNGNPAKIKWSTRPVSATIAPGGTFSTTVVFSSTKTLTNVWVRLTPSMKGTTTVSPTTFAVINAGEPISLDISVAIPADTMQEAFNGTLTLRKGSKAFAKPLPLRFTVEQEPEQ